MPHDPRISDDPGTILDSFADVSRVLRNVQPAAAASPASPVVPAGVPAATERLDEVLYQSPYRIRAPRITICDDNSLDEGEVVYVRADQVVIGRSKGDIRIPNDNAMSGCHAEVVRVDIGGRHGWVLRDLGSSNGTLAKCRSITLRHDVVVLIGSRRYRFDAGSGQPAGPGDEPKTTLLDAARPLAPDALPALVETLPQDDRPPERFPFRTLSFTIGRPGGGNAIELEDLCVSQRHATVTRDAGGAWQMRAEPSLNGIWARIEAVRLTDGCLFQCGEQRFRFHA
jgi:pSer/pThr/pTyr-binding forkhead associated (FHA) protein